MTAPTALVLIALLASACGLPAWAEGTAADGVTRMLLAAKKARGLSWEELGEGVGHSETWVASLFYRQATANETTAKRVVDMLGLDEHSEEVVQELMAYPIRGSLDRTIPTDPLLYRFVEILRVYGLPLKAVMQEKFNDGIMSAVDFRMSIDRVPHPNGDRCLITWNGKWLSYKQW